MRVNLLLFDDVTHSMYIWVLFCFFQWGYYRFDEEFSLLACGAAVVHHVFSKDPNDPSQSSHNASHVARFLRGFHIFGLLFSQAYFFHSNNENSINAVGNRGASFVGNLVYTVHIPEMEEGG